MVIKQQMCERSNVIIMYNIILLLYDVLSSRKSKIMYVIWNNNTKDGGKKIYKTNWYHNNAAIENTHIEYILLSLLSY